MRKDINKSPFIDVGVIFANTSPLDGICTVTLQHLSFVVSKGEAAPNSSSSQVRLKIMILHRKLNGSL